MDNGWSIATVTWNAANCRSYLRAAAGARSGAAGTADMDRMLLILRRKNVTTVCRSLDQKRTARSCPVQSGLEGPSVRKRTLSVLHAILRVGLAPRSRLLPEERP